MYLDIPPAVHINEVESVQPEDDITVQAEQVFDDESDTEYDDDLVHYHMREYDYP